MVVRSAAQKKQSKLNGSQSRGPATAQGQERVRFNALRTGCRAVSLILPGESAEDFASLLKELVDGLQPCDSMEYRLVYDVACTDWRKQRVERAQFEQLKTSIEAAGDQEDLEVDGELAKLFTHPAGRYQLYGVTRPAFDASRNVLKTLSTVNLVVSINSGIEAADGCAASARSTRPMSPIGVALAGSQTAMKPSISGSVSASYPCSRYSSG